MQKASFYFNIFLKIPISVPRGMSEEDSIDYVYKSYTLNMLIEHLKGLTRSSEDDGFLRFAKRTYEQKRGPAPIGDIFVDPLIEVVSCDFEPE